MRPQIKNFSPESYEALYTYAEKLSEGLETVVRGLRESGLISSELEATEAYRQARWNAECAWRDAHEMAITVAKNYAEKANEAVNRILTLAR